MHDHSPIVPYISLCSGYEGIGLGLHRCIPNLRAVAYCEREAFAIANLVAKMENGLLDEAPVFTDVTNFPWADYAPYMAGGILSFGWPCQPVSCAGKRKATEDERWLFDIIADGISILKPGMLFAENVEGLLSARMPDGSSVFGHCVERLESLHYKVAAGIFSASEVGAPHQRKRVFILAERIEQGLEGHAWDGKGGNRLGWFASEQDGSTCESSVWRRVSFATDCGFDEETGELGDTCSICGLEYCGDCQCPGPTQDEYDYEEFDGVLYAREKQAWPSRPGEPQHGWEPPRVVGNAEWKRLEGQWDHTATKHRRDSWFQSWSANGDDADTRQTQPPLGRDTHGTAGGVGYAELCVSCDNRTDELRLLGNGVVPATAERAFRVLINKLNQ